MSFLNIAQAAARVRKDYGDQARRTLVVCCSPAFSALWMAPRLPSFFSANPDIDLDLITTHNFVALEPGVHPDIFITKMPRVRDGFVSTPLFHGRIYPVCTPQYLDAHPEAHSLEGLRNGVLLNLSPHGRSQIAEHVDWGIWLAVHHVDIEDRPKTGAHYLNANDYSLLIQMVLNSQGVALGFDHLVRPLVEKGQLARPVEQQMELADSRHYLACREDKSNDSALGRFRDWFLEQSQQASAPVG